MRKVIRLGDSTSHGGKVVEGCSWFTAGGIPVARMGDKCTCPKKGHNNCVIVEGDPNWIIDGRPVALEGHKLSCGAVLISSAPNAGREESGGGAASFIQANIASDKSVSSVSSRPAFGADEISTAPHRTRSYALPAPPVCRR